MSNETRIKSSFRDPSGYVFREDGRVRRRLASAYLPHYRKLMGSGLYVKLTEKGLLVSHKELESGDSFVVIEPEQVPFISHPYEWCFSMLKDAALATLRVQELALEHGMVLKDASAYNIQFLHGKPVLIDTASFETYVEGEPWIAYGQFCQQFYAPLVLAASVDARLGRLCLLDTAGVALDLAAALLPLKAKVNPAVLLHIVTQAKLSSPGGADGRKAPPRVDKLALTAIAANLREAISGLKAAGDEKSRWADYYTTCTYSDEATAAKTAFIESCLDRAAPALVLDLGANTGRFSKLSAARAIETVAMDIDCWCVEGMYRQAREEGSRHLLPLVQDAMNPSPAIGWALSERESLFERGPADLVFALALIHHLAIAGNVPLPEIAAVFARLARHLVIEFVPKGDEQVQSMLRLRKDIFPAYDSEAFLAAFARHFELVERAPLPGSERELFLMRLKGG